MDAQSSVADAVAIAALLRALTTFLQESREEPTAQLNPLPPWALKDNCFLASRFGIDARVSVNEAGDQSTLRELAESTLSQCRPYAERTGDSAFLDHLARSVASGLPYERCRRVFESSGSLKSVVAASAEELSGDLELSSKTASQ